MLRSRSLRLAGATTAALLTSVALAVPATAPLAAQDYTVEDVLSSSFPDHLVAGPDGRVAWVENDQGERNLWMAQAPDYEGRAVTAYVGDDGQELTNLAFTSDGSWLVFVRGGAPNRAGEIPNPLSNAEWPDRAIYALDLRGPSAEPIKLVDGAGPTVSPTEAVVAYTSGGRIWSIAIEDGAEPTSVAEVRGGPGQLRWSPDGSHLAFVSARGDHAFIGVTELGSGQVRYMAPSVDRDSNPAWSPDGTRIAYVRAPNVRSALPFEPRREGYPWSLMVADVASGEASTVWQADAGPGSVFHGIEAANQIWWGSGDRIVFPWEKNGWVNLYSVRTSGGAPTALATGEFEVEYASMSPDRETMVFASNQDDIDRRHLWRAPVDASRAAELITPGDGLEWRPVVPEAGVVAYMASSAVTPAHARVWANGNSSAMNEGAIPDRFPTEHMVTPEAVVFPGADGMPIHGQLFLPPDVRSGDRRPAVVFFHGGSRRQMLLGFHMRGYYHHSYALNQLLANRGFVVLSVNYRSGIGYGLNFREALDYGAQGASEFNDVLGAGLYLAARDDVDAERIGLWGGSYGGYLTALGLARASDLFAAGVDIHGVHDWNVVVRNFVPSYNAEARVAWSELAYESSPMAHLDGWRSPVLLIHGDDDRNVPFSESVDLAESLRARGVEFEQLIFPDEVHGFLLHSNWLEAYRRSADFLRRKLSAPGVS